LNSDGCSLQGGLRRTRNPPFIYAKKAGYAGACHRAALCADPLGYNPPIYALCSTPHQTPASFPDVQLHIVDAPLGAGPESMLPIVVMDSGLAPSGAPRNDGLISIRDTTDVLSLPCSDLPVGHFCVESPLQKYFASPVGQIISTSSRHPVPLRGAFRDRHGRGVGCGGRGSVRRAT